MGTDWALHNTADRDASMSMQLHYSVEWIGFISGRSLLAVSLRP